MATVPNSPALRRASAARAAAAHPRLPVALADRFHRLLRLPAGRHRLLLLHALQPDQAADLGGAARTGRTSSSRYPLFGPALRNTLWLVVVMVALRVRLRPRHRPADHEDQDGRRVLPHRVLPARTWPRRWPRPSPSSSCSTPAPARSTTSSASVGIPPPDWFNDPHWSKPALTLLALWGIGDLMVIFMAALLDVPKEQYEAAELDGAGALAAVPLRHAAEHLADRDVRRGHRASSRPCSTTPSRWWPERSPPASSAARVGQSSPATPTSRP